MVAVAGDLWSMASCPKSTTSISCRHSMFMTHCPENRPSGAVVPADVVPADFVASLVAVGAVVANCHLIAPDIYKANNAPPTTTKAAPAPAPTQPHLMPPCPFVPVMCPPIAARGGARPLAFGHRAAPAALC